MSANSITGQVIGGRAQTFNSCKTVGEVAKELGIGENYTAKINGNEADYGTELEDYSFVTFGEKVKGGK